MLTLTSKQVVEIRFQLGVSTMYYSNILVLLISLFYSFFYSFILSPFRYDYAYRVSTPTWLIMSYICLLRNALHVHALSLHLLGSSFLLSLFLFTYKLAFTDSNILFYAVLRVLYVKLLDLGSFAIQVYSLFISNSKHLLEVMCIKYAKSSTTEWDYSFVNNMSLHLLYIMSIVVWCT